MLPNTSASLSFPENGIRGIFETYISAMDSRNEVCPSYHFSVLKTIAGSVFGRSGYMYSGRPIYPNFYSCLIGPTGEARKTTAIFLGHDVLFQSDPDVVFLSGLATPEGLLNKLTDKNLPSKYEGVRLIAMLSEFASLLKKAKKLSGEGLIQLLSDAYDMPPFLDNPTRKKSLRAINPCVSVIALSTQDWLESSLDIDDIRGGFANRFCYYLNIIMPDVFDSYRPDVLIMADIIEYIQSRRLMYQNVQFLFDEDTLAFGKNWYSEHRAQIRNEPNELIRDAMQRLDMNSRKLALLYAMLENPLGDDRVHLKQYQAAIEVASYWKDALVTIFGNYAPIPQAKIENNILDKLSMRPCTKRTLQRTFGSSISAKQFNDAMDALIKAERVMRQSDGIMILL